MRYLFLYCFIFFLSCSLNKASAQTLKIAGSAYFKDSMINQPWIGPAGEYLDVQGLSAMLLVGYRHRTTYMEVADSFLLLNGKPKAPGQEIDEQLNIEKYKIQYCSFDTLVLQPVNENAIKTLETHIPLTFVSLNYYRKAPFHFSSLMYSYSGWDNNDKRKRYTIKIDSAGNVYFLRDLKMIGSGNNRVQTLASDDLQKLTNLLHNSALDRFAMARTYWVHAPIYAFYFCFNQKTINATGQVIPYPVVELHHFLEQLSASCSGK